MSNSDMNHLFLVTLTFIELEPQILWVSVLYQPHSVTFQEVFQANHLTLQEMSRLKPQEKSYLLNLIR